jgi:hypothetical protein
MDSYMVSIITDTDEQTQKQTTVQPPKECPASETFSVQHTSP